MKSKSMSRESPHALFSTEGGICSQTPVHAPIVLPVQIGISPVRQDFFMKSKSMSRESPHALFSTEGGICSQTPVHAPIVLPVQIGISPVFWGQGVL